MIPFNVPVTVPKVNKYLKNVLKLKKFSGDGYYNTYSTDLLKSILQSKNVITTSSCSHSLEIALMLLDLKVNDEVLIPDWTFTSVVNSVITQGGKPVFVDCNLNPPVLTFEKIKNKTTEKTKAIILVNYNGIVIDIDKINKFSKENGIYLIQDSAHSLYSTFNHENVNKFGFASTYSFHETKNIQCGEGGSLLLNDEVKYEEAIQIKDKGTNRKNFFEGKVDKYQWVRKGSSYLLAEPLAAILAANLEKFKQIQNARQLIWNLYQKEFIKVQQEFNIETPNIPINSIHSSHVYYLILPNKEVRKNYMTFMAKNNINVVFHYQSLSTSVAGQKYNTNQESFPNSYRLSDTLIRLPLYSNLKNSKALEVIDKTMHFINYIMKK